MQGPEEEPSQIRIPLMQLVLDMDGETNELRVKLQQRKVPARVAEVLLAPGANLRLVPRSHHLRAVLHGDGDAMHIEHLRRLKRQSDQLAIIPTLLWREKQGVAKV
eukprot:scaffold67_cov316-Pinguiococcus_pyrenoidosus.AAC.1